MLESIMEAIAERVHVAWMAEKIRQGFADHMFEEQNATDSIHCGRCGRLWSNHHTDMMAYADLPEHIREYDRVTARAAIEGIAAAGYRLTKNEAAVRAN